MTGTNETTAELVEATESAQTRRVSVDQPPERSQRTLERYVRRELLTANAADPAPDVDFDQRLPQVPGPEARSE